MEMIQNDEQKMGWGRCVFMIIALCVRGKVSLPWAVNLFGAYNLLLGSFRRNAFGAPGPMGTHIIHGANLLDKLTRTEAVTEPELSLSTSK